MSEPNSRSSGVQRAHARAPYHQWLGLKVVAVDDDGIELKATWREEWVVNPDRRYTHGGVLAALVDLARRLGDGDANRPRRADHRSARRLSQPPPCRAISPRAAGSSASAASSRPPRRRSSTRPASCWRAAAAPTCTAAAEEPDGSGTRWPTSSTLVISIRRDRDPAKTAIIDLGGEHRAARIQLCAARRAGERRRAGAQRARTSARRPRCHPLGQPRRISRRLFRHHARGPGRGARQFQVPAPARSNLLFATPAPSSCSAIRAARRLPGRTFRSSASATRCRASTVPRSRARSRRWCRPRTSRRCSSIPRARPACPRASSCRIRAISGWCETRLAGQDLSRHRYLIAAPLYHMNALALASSPCAAQPRSCCCRSSSPRAYIEAIDRYRCTWLTAVPPMIAMMLREVELLGTADLSSVEFIRMGSAPVSQSLMTSLKRTLPQAAVTNAYGTTEAGPVVFGPHPRGLRAPEMSVGYPHPQVQLRLVDGEDLRTPTTACSK